MFGNPSLPSKIFTFGAKKPTTNLDKFENEIKLMHKLKNNLVELELSRRTQRDELVRQRFPNLAALEQQATTLSEQLKAKRDTVKELNAQNHKKITTKEQREEIKQLELTKNLAWKNYKELRAQVWQDPNLKTELDNLFEITNAKAKELRHNSGLYWGNYLVVEQAAKAACKKTPRFHGFNGIGKIAIQIQNGATITEVISGKNNYFQINQLDKKRHQVKIRIGSDQNKPVWLEMLAFIYPRKDGFIIPKGAEIKWVYFHKRKIGTRLEWSLQLVCSRKDGFHKETASEGEVGIDVGWRLIPTGLRVAYWKDHNGKEDQLIIPNQDLLRWKKAEQLQAIRDQNFNKIKEEITEFVKVNPIPEWLTENMKFFHLWKSKGNLAKMLNFWQTNRFANDETIVNNLIAWNKQDIHLLNWEKSNVVKAIRWREHLYRNFASKLSKTYKIAKIEDCNWAKLQKNPQPEDETKHGVKEYARIASVGKLLTFIKERFAEVKEIKTKNTTRCCYHCKYINDVGNELIHTCTNCQAVWDVDANAAKNLQEG